MMNLDLKRAYDYVNGLLDKKPSITVDFLKHLSALVMRNTGSSILRLWAVLIPWQEICVWSMSALAEEASPILAIRKCLNGWRIFVNG